MLNIEKQLENAVQRRQAFNQHLLLSTAPRVPHRDFPKAEQVRIRTNPKP